MKVRLVAFETEDHVDGPVRSVLDLIEVELTDDRRADWKKYITKQKQLFLQYADDPCIHLEVQFGEPDR